MKAMILAAGEGARLRPLTEYIPKCMVPINGKPILEYNIEWLRRFGIREVMINLYHLPKVITDYFGDGSRWGIKITYSIEKEVLGTAGGVKNVEWFFDGPFLIWYGDNLSTCNLSRLQTFHQAKGGVATMTLFYREDVSASGIVGIDDGDRILRFLEKPRPDQFFSHWVNAGIYLLEPSVLNCIPDIGAPDFSKDIFPVLIASGQSLYGYRLIGHEGLWWIDTPDDLLRVQSGLKDTFLEESLLGGRRE
jgi:mannose-1-phosphate guanylyltransferase